MESPRHVTAQVGITLGITEIEPRAGGRADQSKQRVRWAHERKTSSRLVDIKFHTFRHFDPWFALTNRLRTEGTENLLGVAKASGVNRFVAHSFTGWSNARDGP